MVEITYLKGDATQPLAEGVKLICHVCNDHCNWERGFAAALARRWPTVKEEYLAWIAIRPTSLIFDVDPLQYVQAEPDIWVANMIVDRTYGYDPVSRVRFGALVKCLYYVSEAACELDASVHLPRVRGGETGIAWEKVESLLADMAEGNIPVTVYDVE